MAPIAKRVGENKVLSAIRPGMHGTEGGIGRPKLQMGESGLERGVLRVGGDVDGVGGKFGGNEARSSVDEIRNRVGVGSGREGHDPARLATVGMLVSSAGLLLGAITIGHATPVWLLAGELALIGAGFGIFISPNSTAIMVVRGWGERKKPPAAKGFRPLESQYGGNQSRAQAAPTVEICAETRRRVKGERREMRPSPLPAFRLSR